MGDFRHAARLAPDPSVPLARVPRGGSLVRSTIDGTGIRRLAARARACSAVTIREPRSVGGHHSIERLREWRRARRGQRRRRCKHWPRGEHCTIPSRTPARPALRAARLGIRPPLHFAEARGWRAGRSIDAAGLGPFERTLHSPVTRPRGIAPLRTRCPRRCAHRRPDDVDAWDQAELRRRAGGRATGEGPIRGRRGDRRVGSGVRRRIWMVLGAIRGGVLRSVDGRLRGGGPPTRDRQRESEQSS